MEKSWLKNYPHGVPETVNVDVYSSLVEAFEAYSEQFSKHYSFNSFGTRLTYAELNQVTRDFAAYLQQCLKLKKQDRFAIMLPNVLQFPIAAIGILRAGLTVVNINPLYKAPEINYELNDSGATGIIVMNTFAHELEKALPGTNVKHVIVTRLGDCLGTLKGFVANWVVKYIKKLITDWKIPNAILFKEAMRIGEGLELEPVHIHHDDAAFLQYTGGTTGVVKAAVLSHRNILANVTQCVAWVKSDLVPGEESILTALPLYHIFSLTVCCFCFMSLGSESFLIADPRNMNQFIKTLKKRTPTIFVGLNTLFNGLLHQNEFLKLDFSKIKIVIAGGMATQKSVAEQWKKVTGTTIIEGYGLTEASPVVSINPLSIKNFNGSIGLPLPSTIVSIRNEEGVDLPAGKSGELCVKGPQVMKSYWNKPQETKLVFDQEGWLRTGDLAKMDDRGFIYLLDRKKDMILVSGFNVFPNEIENVIASHDKVKEVAVIGIPSKRSGEEIVAYVVKKDDGLNENELLHYCRERLTAYKIPRHIEFCDELPKTNVGKVLRRELRDNHSA